MMWRLAASLRDATIGGWPVATPSASSAQIRRRGWCCLGGAARSPCDPDPAGDRGDPQQEHHEALDVEIDAPMVERVAAGEVELDELADWIARRLEPRS